MRGVYAGAATMASAPASSFTMRVTNWCWPSPMRTRCRTRTARAGATCCAMPCCRSAALLASRWRKGSCHLPQCCSNHQRKNTLPAPAEMLEAEQHGAVGENGDHEPDKTETLARRCQCRLPYLERLQRKRRTRITLLRQGWPPAGWPEPDGKQVLPASGQACITPQGHQPV